MNAQIQLISAMLMTGVLLPSALAAGDANRGAHLFRQCSACHSTAPGEHLTGPSLAHAWNRKAGTAEGFARYSDALRRSGLTWDAATLDKWLAGPEKLVPGNGMTFPGTRDKQAREDLIAYLKAVSENKAPPAPAGGQGMMGMARPKLDLRNPPPEGRVLAIKYCGDTYTVETADGKIEKIWEFNLRFKTDSSKLGPAPGKPVLIAAGMRGDRGSIVFASPGEIGGAIRQDCR